MRVQGLGGGDFWIWSIGTVLNPKPRGQGRFTGAGAESLGARAQRLGFAVWGVRRGLGFRVQGLGLLRLTTLQSLGKLTLGAFHVFSPKLPLFKEDVHVLP